MLELHAPDIECDHCAAAIELALSTVPGVGDVSVDIPTRAVRLSYDDTQVIEQQIRQTLAEAGYPASP